MVNAGNLSSKRYRKSDILQKICLSCGRPFAWRKKWSQVWAEMKTCSVRCKANWLRRKKL